jgi:hypothetical protein
LEKSNNSFPSIFKATFSNENKINSSINQIESFIMEKKLLFEKIIRQFKYLFWWKVLECFLFAQIDRFLWDFFLMVFTSFFSVCGVWGQFNLVFLWIYFDN